MERYLLYIPLSLCLSVPIASSGSHSHYFFTTVTTKDPENGYPFFYMTRSINDITLIWYDSNDMVIERRVPWFRSAKFGLLGDTLNEYSILTSQSQLFQSFRNLVNDTEGFHVLQLLQGCIVYDNGTIDTPLIYHYDGNPFVSFNLEKVNWTAEDPRAQYIADRNNINQTLTQNIRSKLVDTCLPHITELLSMGNCTFNRKEKPIVRVTLTSITDTTSRLNCRAYGHYPKNISMTWYMNGQPVPESLMERVTLPYPDITYLTWLTLTINLKNDDVYSCNVGHSSLTSPLIEDLRLSKESFDISSSISNGGIIAICLAAILVLVLIIFGSVSWARSRRQ